MALVDAINQTFSAFKRNFIGQFYKAYPTQEELDHVKRLWLDMLGDFTAEEVLQATRKVIESYDFIPTLHTMIVHCENARVGTELPEVHSAYIEACKAPSPKAAYAWSHPIVYHAGRACDWFYLHSHSEHQAFPVFRQKYFDLCEKVRAGLVLECPKADILEKVEAIPLDKAENSRRMAQLRAHLDL